MYIYIESKHQGRESFPYMIIIGLGASQLAIAILLSTFNLNKRVSHISAYVIKYINLNACEVIS